MNVPQSPDFGIIGLAISSAPAVPTDPQGAVNAPDNSAGHGAKPNPDRGQGERRERGSSKKEPNERPSSDAGNVAPGKAPHAETSIPPYRHIPSATNDGERLVVVGQHETQGRGLAPRCNPPGERWSAAW